MHRATTLRAPFFEIGPKSYLYGEAVLSLARAADAAAALHGVQVIFTSPLVHLQAVAAATEHLVICAPHMDPIHCGRGVADVLPESLVAAGAHAVMLNHAERPITFSVLEATIERARDVGLLTVVCTSSIAEISSVANLGPDVIVAEPTELIATGNPSDLSYIDASTLAVRTVNPKTLVLQGAGISSPADVERVIAHGADATGSSSAIARADDPGAMAAEMIAAVRRAWNSTHLITERKP